MSDTLQKVIGWTEWEETYKPISNPTNPDDGIWGCMFETFGEDLEALKNSTLLGIPKEVGHFWTLMDNNSNSVYLDIVTGTRWINRMGYFMTEVPWTDDVIVSEDPEYNEEN